MSGRREEQREQGRATAMKKSLECNLNWIVKIMSQKCAWELFRKLTVLVSNSEGSPVESNHKLHLALTHKNKALNELRAAVMSVWPP